MSGDLAVLGGDLDADVATTQVAGSQARGAAAGEGIEDEAARLAGVADELLEQREWFGVGMQMRLAASMGEHGGDRTHLILRRALVEHQDELVGAAIQPSHSGAALVPNQDLAKPERGVALDEVLQDADVPGGAEHERDAVGFEDPVAGGDASHGSEWMFVADDALLGDPVATSAAIRRISDDEISKAGWPLSKQHGRVAGVDAVHLRLGCPTHDALSSSSRGVKASMASSNRCTANSARAAAG